MCCMLQQCHGCERMHQAADAAPLQVSVTLSGYTVAAPFTPAAANFSAPIFFGVGAPLRDHFLNWRVRPTPQTWTQPCTVPRAVRGCERHGLGSPCAHP